MSCILLTCISIIADVHAPIVKCVPVETFYLDPGVHSASITWSEPEVEDNDDTVKINHVSGPNPGDILSRGSHVVKYVASDEAGNSSPCTMTINVQGIVEHVVAVS